MRNKQEAIMNAAMNLIAEGGFLNSPTSAIAKRAGVGVGTIYRYFENKDRLIEAVFQAEDVKLKHALFSEDSSDLPLRERFLNIFRRFIRYKMAHPQVLLFIEQYYHSPYGIDKKREEKRQHQFHGDSPETFNQLLDQAKAQQIVKELENEVLLDLAFAPLVFLLKDYYAGLIRLDDERIETLVAMCWEALKR